MIIDGEAEPVRARDRQEGRDVKHLAAGDPIVRGDGPAVVVGDEIIVHVAERVGDLAEHGAQRAIAIEAVPEAHRVEDLAELARQGEQQDVAVT